MAPWEKTKITLLRDIPTNWFETVGISSSGSSSSSGGGGGGSSTPVTHESDGKEAPH